MVKDGSDMPSVTGLYIRRNIYQKYRTVKKKASHAKRQAKAVLIDLSSPMRAQVLLAMKEYLKSALADDPDMCHGVRTWIRHRVDDVWRDVDFCVEYGVREARAGVAESKSMFLKREDLQNFGETPPTFSLLRLRAWMLYHSLPFDMSIFGNIRDPMYWLWSWPSFVPDLRVLYYIVLIVCINFPGPPDEYQLVQFILMLKAVQFITSGIGMAFMGGLQYFMCVREDGTHTCDKDGPGSLTTIEMGVLDIAGLCGLIWISFLLLPYSRRSAGMRRNDWDGDSLAPRSAYESRSYALSEEGLSELEEDPQEEGHAQQEGCCGWSQDHSRGGRLRGFLRYDLVCFLLYMMFALVISIRHYHKKVEGDPLGHIVYWQLQASLYWARVFYSLLGLPFFVFSLPIFNSIFTHTVPTGYNQNGRIVPFLMAPMPPDEDTSNSLDTSIPASPESTENHSRKDSACEEPLIHHSTDLKDVKLKARGSNQDDVMLE